MRYNVYCKDKDFNTITVYAERGKRGCCEYGWIYIEWFDDEIYTKASLSIFEAKKVINELKETNIHTYPSLSFEYWMEMVED